MLKIITIVGARPQIIKASALSRAISTHFADQITELIVHTGQHYDDNMSAVFFEELGIPQPHVNLKVGSGSHGEQTARILEGIERLIQSEQANALVVYGDTNSTIAGALAAAKIDVPVVHIEAGLRSFNKRMPEEINRILCDHVSTLLFCPTQTAIDNLVKEGFSLDHTQKADLDRPHVYACGDIMFDNSRYFSAISDEKSTILSALKLERNGYLLATIHRNANTDDQRNLNAIFRALLTVFETTQLPVVLPIHPRTRKMMDQLLDASLLNSINEKQAIRIIPPAGFLDIIALEKNARLIITDSGGLQKEAFFFEKPCVILRPETEWVEIVNNGNAILADADEARIIAAVSKLLAQGHFTYPSIFGDGEAAKFIAEKMLTQLT